MKIVVSKDEVYFEWVVEVKYYQIRGTLLIPLRFCVFSHKLTPIPFGETADLGCSPYTKTCKKVLYIVAIRHV